MNCGNEFCPQALETIEDFCVEYNMVDIEGDLQRWRTKVKSYYHKSNGKTSNQQTQKLDEKKSWEKYGRRQKFGKIHILPQHVDVKLLDSNCFFIFYYICITYIF